MAHTSSLPKGETERLKAGPGAARVVLRFALLVLFQAIAFSAWPAVIRAQDNAATPKGILVFYYYGKDYPANVEFEKGVLAALKSTPPGSFEYYPEYLEPNRFPGKLQSVAFQDYLRKKYADHRIDVVVAQTDIALSFLVQNRRDLFSDTPIVFFARKPPELSSLPGEPGYTGIVADHAYQQTLDLALTLHPRTQRVYVVTGTPENDPTLATLVQEQLRPFENKLEMIYLTNLPLDEMLTRVRNAAPGSIILYVRYSQDEPGKTLGPREILALVAQSSAVPIYGIAEGFVGHGIVGGYLFRQEESGKRLTEKAVQIANGARPADMPIEKARLVPLFDWRQLRRWNIAESQLPAGSVVSFKEPTVWELYKWRIIGAVSLIILQALGIAWLLFAQTKRRQAEKKSARFALLAETEHQHLDEIVANVPGIVWEARLEGGDPVPKTTFVSPYLGKMLGYTAGEWLATPGFWLSVIVPEDREQTKAAFTRVLETGEDGVVQICYLTKDGGLLWGEAHLTAICDETGKAIGLRGVTMNITERKRAEVALTESEHRFQLVSQATKDILYEWNLQTDFVWWNDSAMYSVFGYPLEDMTHDFNWWADRLHPDDKDRISISVTETLSGVGQKWENEYRFRKMDHSYAYVYHRAFIVRDEGGQALRVIGSLMDFTERKQSEAALQTAIAEVSKLKNQLEEENIYLREEIKLANNYDEIVGRSDATKYVLYKIEQVAPTGSTVLVTGETGTGKELVARAIHSSGSRKDRPLVRVNCAALTPTLVESELFGHEKGAFTGATGRKIGRFELADGATIFLDEIGELPLELQAKLLRVIQEGEFERLGSSRTLKTDARVIAATNRNLKNAVSKGLFREDLWYRLNVFPITVPPLRERKEDIPLLVEHFAGRFSQKLGRRISSISPGSLRVMQNYHWPGNIRELANVIERAVINTEGSVLRLVDNFEKQQPRADDASQPDKTLEEMEREYITRILDNTSWRIEGHKGAAKILGLNPSTLRTRMAKLGIQKVEQNSSLASAMR